MLETRIRGLRHRYSIYIRHYLALWSVSDCATWHELLHHPGVVKTWKLTVISNSRPKGFARFALGGYYTGGWRGTPPKLQKWHPICSQNTTIWKSRDLDTSDDCDITHNLGRIMGVHLHAKSDVIFRYMTSPMNKKSQVLPYGGPQGVWIWGRKGTPIRRISRFLRWRLTSQLVFVAGTHPPRHTWHDFWTNDDTNF